MKYGSPREHLFECLGLEHGTRDGTYECGKGYIVVDRRAPESFAQSVEGAHEIRKIVRNTYSMLHAEDEWWEQNYFKVTRGPYILVKVFDEIADVTPHLIQGDLIDLFDPSLSVMERKTVYPGEAVFLYDLSKFDKSRPGVAASASKIEIEEIRESSFVFTASSPTGTGGASRVYLPSEPVSIEVLGLTGEDLEFYRNWDDQSSTLLLKYDNNAEGVRITIAF